jgi:pimeloyl-ACP methyl ester carboxylesterase
VSERRRSARGRVGPWAACLVASLAAAQEPVSFPTADGGVVHAQAYGSGDRAVVLAHGGRFDKESWAPQARALAAAGLRVVAIDFRGYGVSRGGGALAEGDDGRRFDVLAAVRWLRAHGATSVAVVGGSMGGVAAAEAAIEAPGEIDRLVLLAHGSVEHPARLGGRKLFVVCRDDLTFEGRPRLVRIREQFELAPEPKQLLVLECAEHAQYIFPTALGDALLATIEEFLLAE